MYFYGSPNTGKTNIMESLVLCHYNFSRLTCLHSNSMFNFGSLVHSNAVYMDECKMKQNQFEQWKLIASRADCSTDIKHKDKQDCVMHTSSNYPIEMYVDVLCAAEAVRTRTIQYNFFTTIKEKINLRTFTWEKLWEKYTDDNYKFL